MTELQYSGSIARFNAAFKRENLHPYLSVGDFADSEIHLNRMVCFNCYFVICLESGFGQVTRGKTLIRFKPGDLVTFKPGDKIMAESIPGIKPRGKVLIFTPEFIENTSLKKDFFMFNFFDYDAAEALSLTEDEKMEIKTLFQSIEGELKRKDDSMRSYILRLGVACMLSLCKRYYERQFDPSKFKTSEFMVKLNELLDDYYAEGSDMPERMGYPTVAWCAEQFDLAPSIFGNIVRRQSCVSAQEFIHDKIIERAKAMLTGSDISVDALARKLGFTYPNHFTRFFKKETGLSPMQFRRMR